MALHEHYPEIEANIKLLDRDVLDKLAHKMLLAILQHQSQYIGVLRGVIDQLTDETEKNLLKSLVVTYTSLWDMSTDKHIKITLPMLHKEFEELITVWRGATDAVNRTIKKS
jgi:hypothetical protein